MSEWQILGIAPTRDEMTIRRAYVRLLKQHRPERDPEGYQRLREAWEAAKRYAASGAEVHQEAIAAAASAEMGDALATREEGTAAPLSMASPEENTAAPLSMASLQESALFQQANGEERGHLPLPTTAQQEVERPQRIAQETELAVPPPLSSLANVDELATQLLDGEPDALDSVLASWQRIAAQGSLLQQQQFHQHLALALVARPGLSEALLEGLSAGLGWELDAWDSGGLLPESVVWQLQQATRQTHVEQGWQTLLDSAAGGWRQRQIVALMTGKAEKIPLWVKLVPNLLSELNQQVVQLCQLYPELAERINPQVRRAAQETHLSLSWGSVFLLLFWGVVLNRSAAAADPGVGSVAVVGLLIGFYLFVQDPLLLSLRRWPGIQAVWLIIEGLFSAGVLALCCLLIHTAILSLLSRRMEIAALMEVLLALVLLGEIWRMRQRGVPFFRWPGMVLGRLLAMPWNASRLVSSWIAGIGVGLISYFAACAVLYEVFKRLETL